MNMPTSAANAPVFNERGLMDALIPPEADIQRSMMQAPNQDFAAWLESRVARFATRRYDWDALKFQADYNPIYRRAQMRYIGTGATGVQTIQEVAKTAGHLTVFQRTPNFSLPARNGPMEPERERNHKARAQSRGGQESARHHQRVGIIRTEP